MQAKDTLVLIGQTGPKSKGIYRFRLQPEGDEVFQNVTLVPLGIAAETPGPTFFEIDLKRRLLFAVNDVEEFEGKPTGAVSAFGIDPAGKLTLVNQRSSIGSHPTQLTIASGGRHLLVANGGNDTLAVFPIGDDGRIGEPTDVVKSAGKSITLDASSRFAFACDFASDRLLTFRFDSAAGTLTPGGPPAMTLKKGAGPRQLLFRPDGRFAYLLNERQSTITAFAFDAASGALTDVQTVFTVPEYFDGPNLATELGVHRSGKWLYVSNCGHNSVVLFTIDPAKGSLTYVEEQGTGGRNPWRFGIDPASKHLAISNRDSDTVLASRIDDGNGRLKPSGIFASLASPASVRFLPPL